jgi:hypothetical protein
VSGLWAESVERVECDGRNVWSVWSVLGVLCEWVEWLWAKCVEGAV